MVRNIAGVVVGLALGVLAILLVEMVGQAIVPLPLDAERSDPAMLAAAVASVPMTAFLFVVLAWAAGAFVGAWIAARLGSRGAAAVVVVILLLTSVYNMAVLPNPLWFWVLGVLAFPALGVLGARMGERGRPASAHV
ncbi:MAG: hypothetical protein R3E98_20525 [Gemmatimonadota bacterium]